MTLAGHQERECLVGGRTLLVAPDQNTDEICG